MSKEFVKCHCGGEFIPAKIEITNEIINSATGNPRYSKRSRFIKKFMKRWLEKRRTTEFGLRIVLLMGPGHFKCNKCGTIEGFYQHMGKHLFSVEPLPAPAGIVHYFDVHYQKP